MLQQYCLREDEISRLIEVEIYDGELYEDEAGFFALMGAWRSWETEFVCLTRTLSIVLERKPKLSLDVQEILKSIYSLPAEKGLGLVFEEMDEAFISYMFRFSREDYLDLEEDLIEILRRYSEYDYSQ